MFPKLLLYSILSLSLLTQNVRSEADGYRQDLWSYIDDAEQQRPLMLSDLPPYDPRYKRWASQLRFGKRASWASKVRFG